MQASEIRARFLSFFERHGHAVRPSSSLVPADDPTLLFTNAGMVQFKKVFLGLEAPDFGQRAATAQKCVRAGGKHNDLEQVGHTARHHTFFEMLGNFSFGDYFKRDAIRFAWDFVTKDLAIDPALLRVSVFREDAEARSLWREVSGLRESRIYGLGEKDNFWQMADTGPCGPCSEIFVDLAQLAADWRFPEGLAAEWTELSRPEFSLDAFVEGVEAGRFLEIWNLVFMQYDRQKDGTLVPLPKPSVDTGAGLERMAAAMQGVTNSFHTDIFLPLIAAVEKVVGRPYAPDEDHASFRVLADHARAVAFLLADGVFPSNEGRGYVLRRILRRAVRHAWLLGRTEPTLHVVTDAVVAAMGNVYPELRQRARHITETTLAEEERFLATIEEGMARFEVLAPAKSTQGSTELRGTISGDDAFRLYDTYGFPIDLTELMARERGYTIDIAGFEQALEAQRAQSREERKTKTIALGGAATATGHALFEIPSPTVIGNASVTLPAHRAEATGAATSPAAETRETRFVGYDTVEIETQVTGRSKLGDGRFAILLRETPFYAESGGQISDHGEIIGEGWRAQIDDVIKIDGRIAAVGRIEGDFKFGTVTARVPASERRDTERNHTATHLLHAALRFVLGEHVHQAGSLVAPDRLRFDFTHHRPLTPEQLTRIENCVNRAIWDDIDLVFDQKPYAEAVKSGAMALFGEKYGDVVRVVTIPGLSVELCGGTHARNTGQIALFTIVSETGVAAGVRRIEAVTGPRAYEFARADQARVRRVADLVKAPPESVVKRVEAILEERRALQRRLDEAMRGGGDQLQALIAAAESVNGAKIVAATVRAADLKELQSLGDALREKLGSGVGVIASSFEDGKNAMVVIVTDDLRERGVRADVLIRDIAASAGGRGGGKPHMAQAGIPDAARMPEAIAGAGAHVRSALAGAA
ncbi:MAG: alanine--tRNA ligase [Gemmatimonadaceae bacterium]